MKHRPAGPTTYQAGGAFLLRGVAAALALLVLAALALAACSSSTSLVPPSSVTPGPLQSNGPISWTEASSRLGERLAVQGPVTSAGTEPSGDVVLTVGASASDPGRLDVIIPRAALKKFPKDAASAYDGQLLTVTGLIQDRAGTATIVVTSRADLKTGL